jgi:3-oxoacyl-[acyl-carrier protein] reductase
MLADLDCPLDIKNKGSILGIKTLADLMKNQEFDHVILISSFAGLAPVSGLSLMVLPNLPFEVSVWQLR